MVTKVQSWGNSQGLRLSRQILEEAHISIGDEVDLAVHDGVIVVAPARRVRGRCSLKDLVARIFTSSERSQTLLAALMPRRLSEFARTLGPSGLIED